MELLPAEIVYDICSQLNTPAIINLTLTCKQVHYSTPSLQQLHRGKFNDVLNDINRIKHSIHTYEFVQLAFGSLHLFTISQREINGKKSKVSIIDNVTTKYPRFKRIDNLEIFFVDSDLGINLSTIRMVRFTRVNGKNKVGACTNYDDYGGGITYEIAGDDLINEVN